MGAGRGRGVEKKNSKSTSNPTENCKRKSRPPQPGLFLHLGRFSFVSPSPPQRSRWAVFVCLVINMATKPRSAPVVCFSAFLPDDYGRLINTQKLIQEKREPRYKHRACQSGTIIRQQILLSFEGDLPENSAVRKQAQQGTSSRPQQ